MFCEEACVGGKEAEELLDWDDEGRRAVTL